MRMKLTDERVASLKPAEQRFDVWDISTPAFGIRVAPSGRKTWMIAARRGGTSSRIQLRKGRAGTFPTMNTRTARALAAELLNGDSAPVTQADTFAALARRFLSHARDRHGNPLRPASLRAYTFVLEKLVPEDAPAWQGKHPGKISRADLADLLEAVAGQRGNGAAALARKALGRFWAWLNERGTFGEASINPAAKAPMYTTARGSRVLEDSEIRAIWHGAEGQFGILLRLLFLTGARRSEVGGMRWSELNLDAGVWLLPAGRTKSKVALELPLTALAIAEIRKLPRILGRDLIFGVTAARGFSIYAGEKSKLDKKLCLRRPWRLHDVRRTVRTRLHQLRIDDAVVRRILNHDRSAISKTYDQHRYRSEMCEALEAWAAELARIVDQPGGQ